ncbi:MAG: hypothetical protein RIC35_15365 [Marinoscillum sp.]
MKDKSKTTTHVFVKMSVKPKDHRFFEDLFMRIIEMSDQLHCENIQLFRATQNEALFTYYAVGTLVNQNNCSENVNFLSLGAKIEDMRLVEELYLKLALSPEFYYLDRVWLTGSKVKPEILGKA